MDATSTDNKDATLDVSQDNSTSVPPTAHIVAHHGHYSDSEEYNDDGIASASTVVHDEKKSALKKWRSRIVGNIYKEGDNPRDYSRSKTNIIIAIVALSGITGPIGSMIYLPGLVTIQNDLNTTLPAINATVAAYVVCLGIAPLFWASFSDMYGRKPMYLISLMIGVVAAILCAVSKNVTMLIVFRAFQACGAGSGQTLGAGVIADTIAPEHRGKAYGIFYIGPLVGPVLGPSIGGALCQFLGWRSTFYFVAILSGVLLILVTFFLPETLRKEHPRIMEDEDGEINKKSERFHTFRILKSAFAPMVTMLGDPTVLLITFYNTVIFSSLYFLTPTITETFESLYGYTEWQVGLCYLVFGLGLMIGSIASGRYADYILKRLREKSEGTENIYPELRLRAVFPSFILIPLGYLIYAWSIQEEVGVYAPLIGLFVYALGQMCAFTPTSVYLVDSKPGRSASAVAINNCVRSVVAAIVTIFSSWCLQAAGPGILFTCLAGINVANTVAVLLVMVFGRKWRLAFEKRTGTGPTKKENGLDEKSTTESDIENEQDGGRYKELALVNSRLSAV